MVCLFLFFFLEMELDLLSIQNGRQKWHHLDLLITLCRSWAPKLFRKHWDIEVVGSFSVHKAYLNSYVDFCVLFWFQRMGFIFVFISIYSFEFNVLLLRSGPMKNNWNYPSLHKLHISNYRFSCKCTLFMIGENLHTNNLFTECFSRAISIFLPIKQIRDKRQYRSSKKKAICICYDINKKNEIWMLVRSLHLKEK